MSQFTPNPALKQSQTAEAIQDWLVAQLGERLGTEPDEIDLQESFTSYGLSSAQALVLLNKLEKWLGRSLSPTLLWNYPTIEAFTQRLAEESDGSELAAKVSPTIKEG